MGVYTIESTDLPIGKLEVVAEYSGRRLTERQPEICIADRQMIAIRLLQKVIL